MIPVGTLCLVLPSTVRPGSSEEARRRIGHVCQVIDEPVAYHNQELGMQCVVRFADGYEAAARYRDLKPIAPPGNPDAVPHREPELVEVFR